MITKLINIIKNMGVKKVAPKKVAEKTKEVVAELKGWCSNCEGRGTIVEGHRICPRCKGECYGN